MIMAIDVQPSGDPCTRGGEQRFDFGRRVRERHRFRMGLKAQSQ
jgi:hypothetical protein